MNGISRCPFFVVHYLPCALRGAGAPVFVGRNGRHGIERVHQNLLLYFSARNSAGARCCACEIAWHVYRDGGDGGHVSDSARRAPFVTPHWSGPVVTNHLHQNTASKHSVLNQGWHLPLFVRKHKRHAPELACFSPEPRRSPV